MNASITWLVPMARPALRNVRANNRMLCASLPSLLSVKSLLSGRCLNLGEQTCGLAALNPGNVILVLE